MQKHIRAIAQNRAGFFKTFRNVVHPVERSLLRSEIADCERLGKTSDGMQILLTDFYSSPALMKEIARLRELTFRKVGEGTGHKTDIDRFDRSYRHLFLWDDRRLEIVGAYRLGLGDELVKQGGVEAFYSAGLFQIQKEFSSQLPTAIECGRSFVQPAYWNSMALDYLWHGIGAFLARHPEYKTLFGPVSISGLFVPEARDMLIYYYKKWYGARKMYAVSNNPVRLSDTTLRRCEEIFCGETAQKDFRILKSALKPYNLAVPALYKQYSELCEPGGVQFADFGVDTDFGGCTDGFIIVDVDAVTDKKRQRYIDSKKEPVSGGVQA